MAVSVEQFYAVRAALSTRFRERAKTGEANGWCRRLLVLEDWPGARVQLGSFDHNKTPSYTFVHPEKGLRRAYPREPIHIAAERAILAALSNPSVLIAALEQDEAQRRSAGSDQERDRLTQELERLREMLVTLKLETAEADPEDRLALSVAQDRVKTQIRTVQATLGQRGRSESTARFSVILRPLLPILEEKAEQVWTEANLTEKAHLAEALLERIVVRIVCPGRRQPCAREIVTVDYARWYQQFLQTNE